MPKKLQLASLLDEFHIKQLQRFMLQKILHTNREHSIHICNKAKITSIWLR